MQLFVLMHTAALDSLRSASMLNKTSNIRGRWLWPSSLLVLTLFAATARWYYVSTAQVVNPVRGDAVQYVNYAWNILTHHTFAKDLSTSTTITPDNYRDPGYPAFLAILMDRFGTGSSWYAAVLMTQAILGALTVAIATQLGNIWLRKRWALIAGVLMAIWPPSISINGYLVSETLFSFLCVLALLLCATAFRSKRLTTAFAAGVVLGSAALTNAVLLPFGVLLAALLAWRGLVPRKLCLALALGAALLPGAWAVRNTQVPISTGGESSVGRALQNFAIGASPEYHGAWRDSIFGGADARAKAAVIKTAADSQYGLLKKSPGDGFKIFIHEVARQPARYAFWYLIQKPYELWAWAFVVAQGDIYVYPTIHSPFMTYRTWIAVGAVCKALNPLLLLMMIAGAYIGLSRKAFASSSLSPGGRSSLISVAGVLFFITVVYSLLQAEPRYAIAFRPFEILLATTAVAGIASIWRSKRELTRQSRPSEVQ